MQEIYNPFTLTGKTFLVTGASSGIGREVAISCSKMGATVIINGRNNERLIETVSFMSGDRHSSIVADLTNSVSVSQLVSSIPQIDGVVHCAGIGHRKLVKFIEEQDTDYVMDTNFKAPIMLQKELISQKKLKKNSSVVFMTSLAADSASIGNGLYSASKGALISFAKCLSLELAPRGIRVNCISPAMVWTNLVMQDGVSEDILKEDEKRYPLKRYGTPHDIANLAIYLLSDASAWMTGSNIKITGGVLKL